jgi:flagellar basal-body rod protein FlgB
MIVNMSGNEILKTADPEMKRLVVMAENIASSRATVLITGESGTGKEVLAKLIHEKSPRSLKRLVAVNCAAIPAELLESELFGFEKGAFTGAIASKPGKFEIANDSTFLLDEISELPLLLQAKLLRVIQEGEVERLGSKAPTRVNVRLIATSNRDIPQMIKEGKFREDLYYRLNVVPLHVAPLRKRPRDIELLARFFTEVSSHINGKAPKSLSEEALLKMKQWNWPGNVRELENVIERSVILSAHPVLQPDDILIAGFEVKAPEWDLSPGMTISEAERRRKTLADLFDKTTRALGASVKLRQTRNNVISSNIANAETPGFQAKKMDFEDALARALDNDGTTDVTQNAIGRVGAEIYENPDAAMNNDGNTVDMDKEMSSLAENSIMYKAAIQLINKKMAALKYAATDGGR